MPTASELSRALGAAWLLLLGRREAIRLFDTSFTGFWRSFLAALFVAPLYVLVAAAEFRLLIDDLPEGAVIDESMFALSRVLVFATDWAAFPILAALLARPLGIGRAYVPLIVAFNWGSPLIAVPLALPTLLFGAGLVSAEPAAMLLFIGLAVALRYRYVAAMAALGGPVLRAVGVVMLEFLLSLVIGESVIRLLGL